MAALLLAASGPQIATLTAPFGWARQDFGEKGSPSLIALWLDRSKAGSVFMPRLFLMGEFVENSTLQSAVHESIATFKSSGDSVRVSKAQRLCGRHSTGWFFAYTQPGAESLLAVEQTILVSRETVYRATYIRSAREREDPDARHALNTLCVKTQ